MQDRPVSGTGPIWGCKRYLSRRASGEVATICGCSANANANANANLLKMPIIAPQAVPGRGTSGPVTKL